MKRLLVLVATLALVAWGGDEQAADPAATPSPTASVARSPLVGTYGAAGADGQPWTTSLAADGTYRNTVAGTLTESGRWTHTGDQLCFTPEGAAAPAGAAATGTPSPSAICRTLVTVNPDGSLVLRDDSGQQSMAPRIPA